ncbi:hypothetical protein [Aurantiacibacter rhizosphaerae]|uniref:Uncharacterized protein n=1 Tax=Aurantiacibacter rhizosphaerae TaxID=2691582 RepID=A0A844X9C7_9SPHN|nr:hypothetical protein [Aurantiacibacter rhizosphaerae]MWV26556.1 hypothetical protein [Aurantiacibacter rhizosphaerae]
MKCVLPFLAAATTLLVSAPSQADSFMPPSVQEAVSSDGSIAVTVIPAMLSCAPGETECVAAARAIVERVHGGYRGNSRTIRLVNPQAPGRVLVTDDGERLLTLDDYASYGFGDNVLVIYGANGEVIARLGLHDFLPEDYIAGLPRTASTLRWWAAPARIEPGTHRAVVSVIAVQAADSWPSPGASGFELDLDLDTGEIESPSGPDWQNALNCARAQRWLVPDQSAKRERDRYRALCR